MSSTPGTPQSSYMPLQERLEEHVETHNTATTVGKPPLESVCPINGELFAFRIDVENDLPLLDKEVLADFEAHRKIYVGHVSQMFGLYAPDEAFHNASIYLLARGHPSSDDLRFGRRNMAVAVEPNDDQLKGRLSLRPSIPLPWDDVYYWTVGAGIPFARIVSKPLSQKFITRINLRERRHLRQYITEDRDYLEKTRILFEQYLATQAPQDVPGAAEPASSRETFVSSSGLDTYAASASEDHLRNAEPSSSIPPPYVDDPGIGPHKYPLATEDEIQDVMDAHYERMSENNSDAPMLEIVTYDLNELEDFGTPEEFFWEVESLKELRQIHRENMLRLSRQQVGNLRTTLAKCPRDVAEVPRRSLSVPPYSVGSELHHNAVPLHRLRAWFHLRAQQHPDARDREAICSEDEERFRAFASRFGLDLSGGQAVEYPIGIDDTRSTLETSMRAASLPPLESEHGHLQPSLQHLRMWYHLGQGYKVTPKESLESLVSFKDHEKFFQFALALGFHTADLEDMDLPIHAEVDMRLPPERRGTPPAGAGQLSTAQPQDVTYMVSSAETTSSTDPLMTSCSPRKSYSCDNTMDTWQRGQLGAQGASRVSKRPLDPEEDTSDHPCARPEISHVDEQKRARRSRTPTRAWTLSHPGSLRCRHDTQDCVSTYPGGAK